MPSVTGFADGSDLVDVLNSQMYAAGTDGFREAIVGIILMVREDLLPALNKARRNRLCAYVHKPPLIQFIIRKFDFSAVDCVKNVLSPRDQQPYDGAALF